MSNKTLIIENVDLKLLDAQRKALDEVIMNEAQCKNVTSEQLELLQGLSMMFDIWSDVEFHKEKNDDGGYSQGYQDGLIDGKDEEKGYT